MYNHFGNKLTNIIFIDKGCHNGKKGTVVKVTDIKLNIVLIYSYIVYEEPRYVALLDPHHFYHNPTLIDWPLFTPYKH